MAIRRDKNKKLVSFIVTLILIVLAVVFKDELNLDNSIKLEDGNIGVYFVDVGQGNCTVVQSGNKGIIIDSGEKEYARTVLDFLESKGISEVSCIIATHPHSDHIGSMATVIAKTKPEKIYTPYIKDDFVPTNKTYFNFLTAIDDNNVSANFVRKMTSFDFGGADITIIPPASQINDLNNMSLIVKVTYGKVSFLIAGDAEKTEMKEVLAANKNFDFSADFYLMAHHGSSTSTYQPFLDSVNFKFAIISCGADNEYGHPHKEALNYLKKYSIESYRTDKQGTISVITDSESCNIQTEKG